MAEKRLLLVDAMNVIYRAFYAIRDLNRSDGKPTNAVYGFIKTLAQLRDTWRPTHWSVVFDGGLPEERVAVLDTYKAQRDPMPDPLEEQLEPIDDYLEYARISSLFLDGQEADDVMATAAVRAAEEGAEVLIATSDKDLFQLVGPSIRIVPPSKSGIAMGSAEVAEKTGVAPEKIVPWLALIGDSVDNIPGVPGVGPKTATKLLHEFGSLESLWDGLERIKSEKLRQKLKDYRTDVERNVGLMTLNTGLPCDWEWCDLEIREPNYDELASFYDEMEFKSMAQSLRADMQG